MQTSLHAPFLHGIHEGLFNAAEQHNAQNQRRSGKNQAVHNAEGRDRAGAQGSHAEDLNRRRHGVELDEHPQARGVVQHRQRVDDGGGVHPELDAEADGNRQIAVFRR